MPYGVLLLQAKCGYLIKRAKISQSSWKRRYFFLNGHALTYVVMLMYVDHEL